jgi:TusE/DsrC/DsvC family sulfur relay protein
MPLLEYAGGKVNVDNDGYLINFEEWNEEIGQVLANQEGVGELTKDKIDILKFMRSYYHEHKFFPILRQVCKNVHQPNNCFIDTFIDPVKAWKIAGLPNPGEEVNMFKSWEPLGF